MSVVLQCYLGVCEFWWSQVLGFCVTWVSCKIMGKLLCLCCMVGLFILEALGCWRSDVTFWFIQWILPCLVISWPRGKMVADRSNIDKPDSQPCGHGRSSQPSLHMMMLQHVLRALVSILIFSSVQRLSCRVLVTVFHGDIYERLATSYLPEKYLFFHFIASSEQSYDVEFFCIPTIPSLQLRKLRLN